MAEVKLNVPVVAQKLEYSCWYAAACMVSYYYRAGPRQGLPQTWIANEGISPGDLTKLAQVEGLLFLNSASHEFTPASLIATISKRGPIWAAGRWFKDPHAIVVTGADDKNDGTVYFNDPDQGVRKSDTIEWFNKRRMRGLMMVKDTKRS